MKVTQLLPLILTLCSSIQLQAQEFIAIGDEELNRLGIVFAPVTAVERHSGSQFPATVVTSPDAVSQVVAPYDGVVENWTIQPGEHTKAGDVLINLRSQAVLELQTQWLLAHGEQSRANATLQRNQTLFEEGIVSQQRLQQVTTEFNLAQVALRAAAGKLAQAGFESGDLDALLESGSASGIYSIRSPIAGLLTHRAVNAGDYLDAFSEVASLQSSNQPWLSVELPSRLANNLHTGQDLNIAGTGETLTLRQKDLIIDETSQTVEILAQFDSAVSYMPGQILSVILAPVTGGVLVPADAVVHSGDQTIVYVAASQGVEARSLQLQPLGANYAAQTGIAMGERVAIQGAALLKGMQLGLGRDEQG